MANAEIKLEYPYSEIWKKGYIVVNPEGRRTLILFNSSDDRTSTQYARYLLAVKLGRFLNDDEQVDHKDNDKTNDNINNLRLLTKTENRLKEQIRYLEEDQICFGYYCAYCETKFILTERQKNMKMKAGTEYAFCSRSCASLHQHKRSEVFKSISSDQINEIKRLHEQGLSKYKIASIVNVARQTVYKYI